METPLIHVCIFLMSYCCLLFAILREGERQIEKGRERERKGGRGREKERERERRQSVKGSYQYSRLLGMETPLIHVCIFLMSYCCLLFAILREGERQIEKGRERERKGGRGREKERERERRQSVKHRCAFKWLPINGDPQASTNYSFRFSLFWFCTHVFFCAEILTSTFKFYIRSKPSAFEAVCVGWRMLPKRERERKFGLWTKKCLKPCLCFICTYR